jgi:hypothetical protein
LASVYQVMVVGSGSRIEASRLETEV